MKHSIPVIAIAACLTLSGLLNAQTEAPVPSEFTAAKAAYEKQLADTNAAKDAAQKAASLKYETALTAAEARATKAGKVDVTKTIPPGTTQLQIGLTRWGAVSATVDYDDIELVFR